MADRRLREPERRLESQAHTGASLVASRLTIFTRAGSASALEERRRGLRLLVGERG